MMLKLVSLLLFTVAFVLFALTCGTNGELLGDKFNQDEPFESIEDVRVDADGVVHVEERHNIQGDDVGGVGVDGGVDERPSNKHADQGQGKKHTPFSTDPASTKFSWGKFFSSDDAARKIVLVGTLFLIVFGWNIYKVRYVWCGSV